MKAEGVPKDQFRLADPIQIRPEQNGVRTGETREQEFREARIQAQARAHLRELNRLQAASEIVIATAVVLGIVYYAKLPLIVVLVSVLLSFILTPLVDGLEHIRLPRSLAALIAVLMFIAVLYAAFYVSFNRIQEFADEVPRYSGEIRKMVTHFRQKAEKLQKTTQSVMPQPQQGQNTVRVEPASAWDKMTGDIGTVSETALIVSFIPFLVYFMLSWKEHARAQTVNLFKLENRDKAHITLGQISTMIRSFIVGNVIVGLFMGGVSLAVFGFLGLPYFYFIGLISGFLSLVPYLGVVLALVPPIAAGLGHVHSTGIIIIVITVFGLHLFALNVLYPKFLGSRLKLNPLAVTLALLFWGWMWGAMGLVLAIPITGAMKIIFDHTEPLRAVGAWLGE